MDRSSRSRMVAGAALVCAWLTLSPGIAYADDQAAAEQLFQEGLAAMKRDDYAVACEAFAQSFKAEASAGTAINLAVCYEKQKKWASAWSSYRIAVREAEKQKNKEREQLAEEAAKRIKPNIHQIVISVKEPLTDLVVTKDGERVAIMLGGKESSIPVDPGEHTIQVSARGKKPWSTVIKAADNAATDRVEVPPLVDAPVETSGGSGKGGVDYQPPIIITNDGSGQRTVAIVVGLGGALLAGLACGGMFILANAEKKERDKQRDNANALTPTNSVQEEQQNELNRSADSHHKAAKNNELLALVFGGAGVVLLGVGAALYFTAPKGSAPKTGKPHVLPLLGPSFAGLGLGGTF